MDLDLVGRGFLLGFAVAAPVGPIGVLVIRRTLAVGPRTGFISGLGGATADAAYGSVAALCLTTAAGSLVAHSDLLRLGGGLLSGSASRRSSPARLSRMPPVRRRRAFGPRTGPPCFSASRIR